MKAQNRITVLEWLVSLGSLSAERHHRSLYLVYLSNHSICPNTVMMYTRRCLKEDPHQDSERMWTDLIISWLENTPTLPFRSNLHLHHLSVYHYWYLKPTYIYILISKYPWYFPIHTLSSGSGCTTTLEKTFLMDQRGCRHSWTDPHHLDLCRLLLVRDYLWASSNN